MSFFLILLILIGNFLYAEEVKAPRPTSVSAAFCAGCADDGCCNQVLADLAVIESQLQELIQCACCQYDITQADIDGGSYTITEPGIYCLAEDVTFTGSGNAITINNTQPQVFLDLKGHSITGDGTGVGIFITNTAYGTTVYNGSITECDIAISLLDSTQVILSNLNISLCNSYGIYTGGMGGSGGIFIMDCFVRDIINTGISLNIQGLSRIINTIVTLTGGTGIQVSDCFECFLDTVNVINCAGYGYLVNSFLSESNVVTFENCIAEACQSGGFIADANTGNVGALLYKDCRAIACDANGFDLVASVFSIDSVEYLNCEAKGLLGNGFSSNTNGSGSNISSVTYKNCFSHLNSANGGIGANGDGFFVDGSFFVLQGCNAEKNQGSGIILSVNSFNNEVRENTASQNGNFGIEDLGSVNLVYSNIASGNAINYSAAVPLQLMPTDITGYWINVDPTSGIIGEYESKINELINFEESCCQAMGSSFDVMTSAFDVVTSDVDVANSQLVALNEFEVSCCDATTSSFDVVTSEVQALSVFEQSCCQDTMSGFDVMTSSFDVVTSDVDVANSQLVALSAFEVSCCDATTSSFDVVTSEVQAVSVFDQSCCSSTMSAFDVITSSIDALDTCAPVFITSLPYAIPGPGVYVLCSELTAPGGSVAISIPNFALGQIVLDFNGHAIVGAGTDAAIQVFGNGGEVVIQNGSIQFFSSGIEVYGQNVSIKDMNLLAVGSKGIYVEGGENIRLENLNIKIFSDVGIEFYSSSDVSAKNCQIVSGGAGSIGLFCNGVINGVFDNIEVSRAIKYGISVVDGPLEIRDVIFSNCFVADSDGGLWIEQQNIGRLISGLNFFDTIITGSRSSGITIRGVDYGPFYPVLFKNCTIERTRGTGVEFFFGTSHILDNCTISFNDGIGIFMDGSNRCQILNSTINNNGSDAISINSSNCVVKNSVINNNIGRGIYIWNNMSVLNTQVNECLVNDNDDVGIYIEGSDRAAVEGCVVSGNRHGIIIDPASSNTQVLRNYVMNNPGDGIFNNSGSGYVWGNYSYANGSNYGGIITSVPVLGAGYWDNVF